MKRLDADPLDLSMQELTSGVSRASRIQANHLYIELYISSINYVKDMQR